MNEQDRQLEAMAAEVAGYKLKWEEPMKGLGLWWIDDARARYGRRPWHPLGNNSDAFELMVARNIELYFESSHVNVRGTSEDFKPEPFGQDPAAAVRRVIVRAVASGEAL